MDNQARIPAPNFTQIPNAIFELMADKGAGLTEAELRVILAIARKTFGWHKKRDKISLSQLVEMTSMSRTSVVAGLRAAQARGIVRQTPDKGDKRGGMFYELVVEDIDQPAPPTSTKSELVQILNQSKIYTRTSTEFEPELVQNLNTQNKGKEKKERGGEETQPARPLSELALAIADVCKINPKIPTDKQKRALNATYLALKGIGATPADVRAREKWWYANDWRAKKEGRAPRPDELQAIWEEAAAPVKKQSGERVAPTARLSGAKPIAPADAQPAQQTAAKMKALLDRNRDNNAP